MKDIKIANIFVTKAKKTSAIGKKLIDAGIISLEDLKNTSDETLLAIPGIGVAKLESIKDVMDEHGITREVTKANIKKPKTKETIDKTKTGNLPKSKNIGDNYIKNPNKPKFDILISEVPFDKEFSYSCLSKSLYHNFIDRSLELDPEQILYVGPSSFFVGNEKLTYKDIFKSYDKFSNIVCFDDFTWFNWKKNYSGNCVVDTESETLEYDLNDYTNIITSKTKLDIINKLGNDKITPYKDYWYISSTYFNFCKTYEPGVICYHTTTDETKKVYYSERKDFENLINKFNVIIPRDVDNIKGNCKIITNSCWTSSFTLLESFDTKEEAEHFVKYIETKFVEFIALSESTNNFNDKSFKSIDRFESYENIDDEFLFKHYNLSDEEIEYIKSYSKSESTEYNLVEKNVIEDMMAMSIDDWEYNKTFLDLYIRDGRVLGEVFSMKLVNDVDPIDALKSIYGVSPNVDDVIACKVKLLETFECYSGRKEEAIRILNSNIKVGNPLYCSWDYIKVN